MFGADAIQNFVSGFTFACLHFVQTALDAAQGIHQIVRAQSTRFQHANMFADGMLFGFTQSQLHAAKNEFTRKQSQTGIWQTLAMEWRAKVAHGETVGINAQSNKAPDGAEEISIGDFLPPLPGLKNNLDDKPTVSPWATFCRVSGAGVD